MNLTLLPIFGISVLAILPVPVTDYQSSSNSTSTCRTKITQLEEQIQSATNSIKVIHFIEGNTTEFKSLNQKYMLYWVNTKYSWDSDISTCSAKLEGITASFQISNSTFPFLGMVHITVDPAMTKVLDLKVDTPSTV